ncbi:MAG: TipC family immunity protein [Streptococcus sp.]|nr:TipC family immunity protein [Streptococcus sp.]
MKKKMTIMILIASGLLMLAFALPISIYYINLRPEPRNIFDEIYLETEKTYRSNNILGNIDGFDIKGSWSNDNEYSRYSPFGNYVKKSIPNDYSEVGMSFYFESKDKNSSIYFDKKINSNTTLSIWSKYNFRDKTLSKTIWLSLKENGTEKHTNDESQVKAYLQKYGITADDLDRYYDEIVNKKVLPDWCSIYDSKFSPSNYGDITIKTQWKDW